MKTLNFLLSAALLCFSQFVFAVATPAQVQTLDNALSAVALNVNNASLVDAAVQAAANADIAENDIVTRLFNLGVSDQLIRDAMSKNINVGTLRQGIQLSCSPRCGPDHLADVSYLPDSMKLVENTLAGLAATGAGGATGGGAGGGGGGGAGMPATGSGPNGAVTPG